MSGNLKRIGEFSPYTGVSDEICTVFIATNLIKSPLPSDITEEFELFEISINDFEQLIKENIIWDGLTLSAWMLAKKQLLIIIILIAFTFSNRCINAENSKKVIAGADLLFLKNLI